MADLPIYEWFKQQHERATDRLADINSEDPAIRHIVGASAVGEVDALMCHIAETEKQMALFERGAGKPE